MPGIYVHVPFCKSKCAYCDFASYPKEFSKCDLYFACLYKEIKGRSESLKDYVFDTVYFGGGTPSYVDPKYVIGAMRQIRNYYKIADNAEITIEMNPGTVDENKIKQYEKAGFNRFSVGLQTANDDLLRDIGRIHTKADFVKTAELLKGKNFSVDIMIGLEGQTTEDIKEAVDLASSAGAKHISSYALKAEEGTPMYGRYLNGDLPSEDEVADEYDFTVKYLAEKGYKRYEVSNFCKDGFYSRHNLNYWKRGEYIGFGVSASSFIKERRFTNTEKIDEYTACIIRGKVAEIFSEDIEGDEREFEYIMLGLRTADGISFADFKNRFGTDFKEKYSKKISTVAKYLSEDENGIKIKSEYLFVQNEIIIHFMD